MTSLERIRKYCDKTTNGPWEIRPTRGGHWEGGTEGKYFVSIRIGKENERVFCADSGKVADLEFIINSRTDLPKLLEIAKAAIIAVTHTNHSGNFMFSCPACSGSKDDDVKKLISDLDKEYDKA